MKKRKRGRKLSRKKDPRKALLKALASALILNEKIKTTEAKAKEVSRLVEKFISRAKKGLQPVSGRSVSLRESALLPDSLAVKRAALTSRRLLTKFFSPKIVKKLVDEIGPRYQKRKGGCTRIIKLGSRKADGAKMAIIELVK